MLKKDLILKSPVSQTLGIENVKDGRFGAVISRAGVGKTSFLVQIAITQLLRNEKILHISLVESIEKINLRYSDGYTNLIDSIGYVDPQKALRLWEDISPNKVGISYNEITFDTEKIKDYLKSFKKADLTMPSIIIMDGLNFDKDVSEILEKLDQLSREFSIFIWFSIKSHREEKLCDDGYPIQLETYKDKFDKAVFLNPVEDKINAVILKDGARTDHTFKIDSATMMIAGEE
ncbi:MAG: hypothetical protein A3J80_09685 [Desulfobacula sp. RIFOXYB2_FULL_45_6]|nr:MAG: hypothetical protein A3J80_09685 [Desulfobacula sp. RIFOXYB2_FULL_45_6]